MIDKLFRRIKELEKEIEDIQKRNKIVSENIKKLFRECKIEKSKKEEVAEKLKRNLSALEVSHKAVIFKDGVLAFSLFLDLIDEEMDIIIIAIDAEMDKMKQKFLYGYFTKKFNPLFTIKNDVIYGVIDKKHLDEIKKINKLPFMNPQTQEFDEIDVFKVIFLVDEMEKVKFTKIEKLFNEFKNRPSFKNKHFIVYSLERGKLVDFELEEARKVKTKYSYIYDETYPSLEGMLKKEIKNVPFVLTLLERIDSELDEIKKSRGTINVVNRILNYIQLNLPEEAVIKMVNSIRNNLNDN